MSRWPEPLSTSRRFFFADEPTGNLDGETAEKISDLLFELNEATGTTLVLVTHNLELAQRTQRIISLKSGSIGSDENLFRESECLLP